MVCTGCLYVKMELSNNSLALYAIFSLVKSMRGRKKNKTHSCPHFNVRHINHKYKIMVKKKMDIGMSKIGDNFTRAEWWVRKDWIVSSLQAAHWSLPSGQPVMGRVLAAEGWAPCILKRLFPRDSFFQLHFYFLFTFLYYCTFSRGVIWIRLNVITVITLGFIHACL